MNLNCGTIYSEVESDYTKWSIFTRSQWYPSSEVFVLEDNESMSSGDESDDMDLTDDSSSGSDYCNLRTCKTEQPSQPSALTLLTANPHTLTFALTQVMMAASQTLQIILKMYLQILKAHPLINEECHHRTCANTCTQCGSDTTGFAFL
ncbi:hypothetical protein EI94DRAFT_1700168 [Lactarius quietus]|nr:hypothetical protein EI94DRAFT_1700168 [Lactarius quietus]